MNKQADASMGSDVGAVDASDARGSAAYLWARLCLPAQVPVALPIGELLIRPRLSERAAPRPRLESESHAGEVLALEVEQHPGVLLVERRMALGLVHAILGLPWPTLAGPLSRIERGMLEGTVATTLAHLGFAGRIRVCERARALTPTGAFTIELSLSVRGSDGWACLMSSDEALRRLCTPSHARDLVTGPWLEVASTRVPAGDLAGAEPGDRVVFDETPALLATKCWPARLLWRGNTLAARWLNDGTVVIPQDTEEPTTKPVVRSPGRTPLAKEMNASGRWVEVSAGSDCAALVAAGLGPLVVSRAESMVLRADGRVWAYGSVTETDQAFAVTITAKAE
jgi:hypothetical protein